jgi:hypothetical protein
MIRLHTATTPLVSQIAGLSLPNPYKVHNIAGTPVVRKVNIERSFVRWVRIVLTV